jgi:uncharacterized membrane protein
MSVLIAITFDGVGDAAEVRQRLKDLGAEIDLDDAAVVSRSAGGSTHVDNEVDQGIKFGALGGGALGLLLTFPFPLIGAAIGAAGGALVGRSVDLGLDQRFVADVTETLQPGNSALFLLVRSGNPDAIIATLNPFEGHVYQTTLGTEAEESLRRALDDRGR